MPDDKQDNNSSTNNSSGNSGPDYPDWREQRRIWRDQRREERHRDPFRGLFWGLLLIMLGVIFFAAQQNWISGDQWWQFILIGLGAIFIINGLVHYLNPAYRHFSSGQFIPGVVLLFVGIAFIFNFSQWWPIVLIGIGAAILISLIFRRS